MYRRTLYVQQLLSLATFDLTQEVMAVFQNPCNVGNGVLQSTLSCNAFGKLSPDQLKFVSRTSWFPEKN